MSEAHGQAGVQAPPDPSVCPVCGSLFSKEVRALPGYRKCRCCKLIANCRGTATESYSERYFHDDPENAGRREFESPWAHAYDARRFGYELRRLLPKPSAQRRLLDVGAGTGTFLVHARDAGWSPYAVEVSDYGQSRIRAKGFSVCASVAEAVVDAPYAVITAHHVIEHLSDPLETLRRTRDLLLPGGSLLVEVPNWRSGERLACGEDWVDLRPDQHLFHYSPKSLRWLLDAAGFEIARVGTLGEPMPTRASLMTSLGLPLARPRRVKTSKGQSPVQGVVPGGSTRPSVRALASVLDGIQSRLLFGKRLYAIAHPR